MRGCRLTVASLEFCFSRGTSVRRAPCARKRCRCVATSCVPSKVPVVCFALFPMGAVKWLGEIIDISFDLTTFENKSHCCGFYLDGIILDGSILEQVKQFNYLGCELSLDGEPDFDKKLTDFKEYAALLENT